MKNANANPIKLRRAPNGRLYAVCHAQPVCKSDGNLRYFETEHEALNRARQLFEEDETIAVAICDAAGNQLAGVRLQLKLGYHCN